VIHFFLFPSVAAACALFGIGCSALLGQVLTVSLFPGITWFGILPLRCGELHDMASALHVIIIIIIIIIMMVHPLVEVWKQWPSMFLGFVFS